VLLGSLPGILFVTSHASSSSSCVITTEFVAFPVRVRLDPRPQQQLTLTRSFSLSFEDRIRIVAAFGLACVAKYQQKAKDEEKRQLPVVDSVVAEAAVEEEPIVRDEKLSSVERYAVRRYTGEDHRRINESLRGTATRKLSRKGVRKTQEQVDGILRAMSKTPSKVFKGTVYRGTHCDQALWESMTLQPGAIYSDKGFLSTTTDRQQILKFIGPPNASCIVFTIKSKTGWSLGKLSSILSEAEVLFRPSTRFLIQSVEKCASRGCSLVTMEEIG